MIKKNSVKSSAEDYLEAFLLLEKEGKVKSVEVAKALSVTKAAVSIATKELAAQGLIEKKSYGDIMLTEAGRKIASEILSRHKLIKRFLVGIGVQDEIAEADSCEIEHCLSEETVNRLQLFVQKQKF